jgi:hypothetical protein
MGVNIMSYTLYQLLSTDSIGDSLSAVNINYENLDEWTTSIQMSATNYWEPLVNFYENVISNWNTNASYLSSNKLNWDNMIVTVENNMSKWVTPLVVMYPNILNSGDLNHNISIITKWLNTNSPCISSQTVYVENQKAYVYALSSVNQTVNLINHQITYGHCQTTKQIKVCASCKTKFFGTALCSNGDMICDGGFSTCNECGEVNCQYPQTGTYIYNPAIEAYLTCNYTDSYESEKVVCLNYVVSNCEWVFVKSINSTISQQ